jgi:hypothetical protein
VADVKQIETTVGQGNGLAGAAPVCHAALEFGARNNLSME